MRMILSHWYGQIGGGFGMHRVINNKVEKNEKCCIWNDCKNPVSGLLPGTSIAGPLNSKYALVSRAEIFDNPVIQEDYPDLDVFRVCKVFYYAYYTFAFSPGAPVLKSINKFMWYRCIQSTGQTYIWTADGTKAAANNGEGLNWNWTVADTLPKCYYDNGVFIDDDDMMYMVYDKYQIKVAQLNAEGTADLRSQQVYDDQNGLYLEGFRIDKINRTYYIFATKPADEWVLKSDIPYGPHEARILVNSIAGPLPNAGNSHQGDVVDTKDINWFVCNHLF